MTNLNTLTRGVILRPCSLCVSCCDQCFCCLDMTCQLRILVHACSRQTISNGKQFQLVLFAMFSQLTHIDAGVKSWCLPCQPIWHLQCLSDLRRVSKMKQVVRLHGTGLRAAYFSPCLILPQARAVLVSTGLHKRLLLLLLLLLLCRLDHLSTWLSS